MTLTPYAKPLAAELSLPVLRRRSVAGEIGTPKLPLAGHRRRASFVNFFFSRTTEPIFTKFGMNMRSICRMKRQESENFMTFSPTQKCKKNVFL